MNVVLLDKLMNLVGELVLARNQVLQFSNSIHHNGLVAASRRLNLITTESQEDVHDCHCGGRTECDGQRDGEELERSGTRKGGDRS